MRSNRVFAVFSVLVLITVAGCGEGEEHDLEGVTAELAEVETVVEVIKLTSENDISGLLGTPEGYHEAAVVHDSGLECLQPAIDCGVVLERWGSREAALARSEQVRALQMGMQDLGAERHFLDETILLRVNADLSQDIIDAYAVAFAGEDVSSAS